ncbi:MAG: type II toxin-antitoxin system RelB/DinJ family antitoxin [Candidatus Paceibacterota bacterium]
MSTATAKTTFIRARVNPRLKREAETVFRAIGVNTTSAVTMFLKQVSIRKGMPFDVCVPNEETIHAFNEKLNPRSAYMDADKLMADILTGA